MNLKEDKRFFDEISDNVSVDFSYEVFEKDEVDETSNALSKSEPTPPNGYSNLASLHNNRNIQVLN